MPAEYDAIQAALTSDDSKPTCAVFTKGICPGQFKFYRHFYRLLDSNDLDPAVKSKLAEVEESLFIRQVSTAIKCICLNVYR